MRENIIRAIDLGRLSYRSALVIQQKVERTILNSLASNYKNLNRYQMNTLLLVEHNPVYTVGIRHKDYVDVEEKIHNLGADFYKTNRGGLITFHGPGQLVAYPVLYLKDFGMSMKQYVNKLEKTIIRNCQHFGVESHVSQDTGVWIGNRKIAAIGVHGRRFVVTHGLGLNCNTDLHWFDHIVPCGLKEKEVTSLTKELGQEIKIEDTIQPFLNSFSVEFKCDIIVDDKIPDI